MRQPLPLCGPLFLHEHRAQLVGRAPRPRAPYVRSLWWGIFPQVGCPALTPEPASSCGKISGLPRCGPNNASLPVGSALPTCRCHDPRGCHDRAAATSGFRKALPAPTRGGWLRPRGPCGPPPLPASPAPVPSAPLLGPCPGLGSPCRVRPATSLASGTHRKWAGGACR